MRCIVVGAGIVGVTVAWRLAQRGGAVTLLDRALPGAGTTGTSFAWVNASSKEPRPYFELNAAGMVAHARLAAEFGDAPWLVPTGNLEWDTTPDGRGQLVARASQLKEWGYDVRHLTRREVERLEPDLLMDQDVQEVVFYPDESFIFPSTYLACLVRAASERGCVLRFGEEVVEIMTTGGHASGVVIRSGAQLHADVVICCCGRWTSDVLRTVGVALPLVPLSPTGSEAVGLLVRSSAVTADVRRVIHPPGLAIRPDGGGRLLLHGSAFDREVSADLPMSPPPSIATKLVGAVRPLVRYMQHASIESAAIGIRPIPVDGFSAVGRIPSIDGIYVIVTHSGVTLAPILAELAVSEIHGSVETALDPFRPDRFN